MDGHDEQSLISGSSMPNTSQTLNLMSSSSGSTTIGVMHNPGSNNPVILRGDNVTLNYNLQGISEDGNMMKGIKPSSDTGPGTSDADHAVPSVNSDLLDISDTQPLVSETSDTLSLLPSTSKQLSELSLLSSGNVAVENFSVQSTGSNNFTPVGINSTFNVFVNTSSASVNQPDSSIRETSTTAKYSSSCSQSNLQKIKDDCMIEDGIVFLIDCSKLMFHKSSDGDDSPFQRSVNCVLNLITNKLFSLYNTDRHGVIFFGTDKTQNHGNHEHIYVLQDLQQASVSQIEELEALVKDKDKVIAEYGYNATFKLTDALEVCSDAFSRRAEVGEIINHKRVLLFTNTDNPHSDRPDIRRQAKKKARELCDSTSKVQIKLMCLGQEFDNAKFYNDFLHSRDDSVLIHLDAPANFDAIVNREYKPFYKRAVRKLKFTLGEGLHLGIGIYNLVQKSLEDISGMLLFGWGLKPKLEVQEIYKYMHYAGKDIYFTEDETKELSNFGDAGLFLLGFKPSTTVKRYNHVRPPQFIFPEETMFKGSTRLFSALHQRCLAREKVAICKLIKHDNNTPKLVALLPQEEELDEHGVEISPPGFHLITLPYADELRKPSHQFMQKVKRLKDKDNHGQDEEERNQIKKKQTDKAKEMINKLQFQFRTENYKKTVTEKFNVGGRVPSLLDVSYINQRADIEIDEFKRSVSEGLPGKPPYKSCNEDQSGSSWSKRKMPEDEYTMMKYAEAGQVHKLTVAVLKAFCNEHRLCPDGSKQHLLETVYGFFGLDSPIMKIYRKKMVKGLPKLVQ